MTLLYFWLSSPELAQARVETRVKEGGHHIPPEVIKRRYWQGLRLLFDAYLPLVNEAWLYDNSSGEPALVAQKLSNGFGITNDTLYQQLRTQYESEKTA